MDREREIYISLDVETDGKICGLSSMLSLGAAAVAWDREKRQWDISSTFSANLVPLPNCTQDADTMKFWSDNPVAWKTATSNQREAALVMQDFRSWLCDIGRKWNRRAVAVGAPAAFDFPFVRYYLIRFTGTDEPFRHSCLDTKSIASTLLKLPYYASSKSSYPKSWSADKLPHTHVAVDDAVEQGYMLARMIDSQYGIGGAVEPGVLCY